MPFYHELVWLKLTDNPKITGSLFDDSSNFLRTEELYLLDKNIGSFHFQNFLMYPHHLDSHRLIIYLDRIE